MVQGQNCKWFTLLAPISLAAGATTLVIDCMGFEYLEIVIPHGLVGAADYSAMKIQESDVKASASTLTGGVDVTGLIVGTSLTIAGATSDFPGDTDDGLIDLFEVDLRARKRYLLLVLTAGIGSLVAAIGRLSRAEGVLDTAASKGVRQVLRA